MVIRGSVENIIFYNEENGYTVLELDWQGHPVTCQGNFPRVAEGEMLELTGEFRSTKYGEQFAVESVEIGVPESLDGITRYLASGLFKGIGPATAQAIAEKFRGETLKVIELEPMRLAQVKGITKTKAQDISKAVRSLRDMRASVMFMQKYGISINLAIKIYKAYGEGTEGQLTKNPYRLVEDIDGVGFITADRIARSMGIEPGSEFRLRAGLVHSMQDYTETSGSTYITLELLVLRTANLLGIAADDSLQARAEGILGGLLLDGVLSRFTQNEQACYALREYYNIENSLAARIVRLKHSFARVQADVRSEIKDFEFQEQITLHDIQRAAVESAATEGVAVITGGPGTGKTTIIKCLLHLFKRQGLATALCAPTGRAAKRLSEQTGEDAKTIHRLLDLDYKDGKGFFTYNERTRLPAGAVVVDEVSMVDCHLMHCLLRAVEDGSRVVFVGDKDQLPSVSPGNVLSDIIESGTAAVTHLQKIYRQSEGSRIVENAHRINSGEMPVFSGKDSDFLICERSAPEEIAAELESMYNERIPKYLNINATEIQVLAPMKKGVCGVDNLNRRLQALVNPAKPGKAEYRTERVLFRLGDKVMQTVNNYKMEWSRGGLFAERGQGVFNGDIGFIEEIARTGELTVAFDDGRIANYTAADINDLTLSYAISIHKSQGCEFDVVIVPVTGGHERLFNRNLLYTAITRAKKLVVLIGSKYSIKRMVDNDYTEKRYTLLADFLKKQQQSYDTLHGGDVFPEKL